jgi:hypothetical protein
MRGDKFSRDTADVFSKLVVVSVALQRLKLLNNRATFSNECGFLNRFQAAVILKSHLLHLPPNAFRPL